ncbi:MAG: mercuric reductase [Bryobacteraceae bacterium]|nr:mercuric reductase [Bryobacteraceae bacterium]
MTATTSRYDAIIIGTGQGGVPLAHALAGAGKRTAIVEKEHVGGSCINEGCTPTKTMAASARVAYLARRAADYGVETGGVGVRMEKVRERKRAIVEQFRDGGRKRLETNEGVDLVFGHAEFSGPGMVQVRESGGHTRELEAEWIVINTGGRPAVPAVAGIERVPMLTNRTIMELDRVPDHLVVIGGGYIGVEFAQMFRRFGSAVTLVHTHERLLAREDQDVAEEVAKILGEDGIRLHLGSRPRKVEAQDGGILLEVDGPRGTERVEGTHLLAAAGRTPNTDGLGLERAGVTMDKRGFIPVNERLETNVAGIWAIGDVNGGPAFTHISYDDFRILRANLLEGGKATTTGRLVPYTVFMDPQLGRVGMSETEAARGGRQVRVAKMPMSRVARALEMDEPRGLMKAVVDAESSQILGVAVLGVEGGEIMSALQVAMMAKLPYQQLRDGIFAHPTLAESLNNLFAALD